MVYCTPDALDTPIIDDRPDLKFSASFKNMLTSMFQLPPVDELDSPDLITEVGKSFLDPETSEF